MGKKYGLKQLELFYDRLPDATEREVKGSVVIGEILGYKIVIAEDIDKEIGERNENIKADDANIENNNAEIARLNTQNAGLERDKEIQRARIEKLEGYKRLLPKS